MNQGKLEVVKQEMTKVNVNILGISKLKWTGTGEFNSDDHYIYYCGQESLRRNGVVNKRAQNTVLGCNLKNERMISVRFQGKPFNIMVIQQWLDTGINFKVIFKKTLDDAIGSWLELSTQFKFSNRGQTKCLNFWVKGVERKTERVGQSRSRVSLCPQYSPGPVSLDWFDKINTKPGAFLEVLLLS